MISPHRNQRRRRQTKKKRKEKTKKKRTKNTPTVFPIVAWLPSPLFSSTTSFSQSNFVFPVRTRVFQFKIEEEKKETMKAFREKPFQKNKVPLPLEKCRAARESLSPFVDSTNSPLPLSMYLKRVISDKKVT